jgi:hypothetical protein
VVKEVEVLLGEMFEVMENMLQAIIMSLLEVVVAVFSVTVLEAPMNML